MAYLLHRDVNGKKRIVLTTGGEGGAILGFLDRSEKAIWGKTDD